MRQGRLKPFFGRIFGLSLNNCGVSRGKDPRELLDIILLGTIRLTDFYAEATPAYITLVVACGEGGLLPTVIPG
jgi:hypothetical protein